MKIEKYTMKFIIFVLGVLFIAVSAQALPTVTLQPSTTSVYVGDTFTLDIIANGVTDFDPIWGPDELLSFGFDVDYVDSEFAYNSATVAFPFFDDSGSFDDTDVAGMVLPGISGDNILLASLSFTSLSAGDFSLGILSDVSDPNEGLETWLYYYGNVFGPGQIDISSSADITVSNNSAVPTPEPGTMFLFGLGLIILTGFGKKLRNY